MISTGLTGQSAFYGKGALLSAQLLANKINAQGGLKDNCGNTYTVKLQQWDDGDNPAQSSAGFRKAASDPSVLAVIGSDSDVAWLPQLPLAGELKMPLIVPSDGSTVPQSKWNPWAFRVFGSEATTFQVALKKLEKVIHFKRVGILYDITQQAQTGDAQNWQANAAKFGYKVVAFESFRVGDTDFRSQLSAIKAAHPDLLVINASEPSGQYNQAKQLGLIPAIPAYSAFGENESPQEWKLTNGAVKGSLFFSPTAISLTVAQHDPTPIQLYQKAAGVVPNAFQIVAWDGLNVALNAVKQSCTATDRTKFRDALAHTTNFPISSQGVITWKNPPTGENLTPNEIIGQVTGPGQFKLVGSVT
jgi:branched-chain amino acid transport system substrate-binding protein